VTKKKKNEEGGGGGKEGRDKEKQYPDYSRCFSDAIGQAEGRFWKRRGRRDTPCLLHAVLKWRRGGRKKGGGKGKENEPLVDLRDFPLFQVSA